ncbi:MAG: cob(I)yrinic acid a,c-diamide adenosyltransferase [Candidatus Omnitrophica bacterium]|nr:cob(I)yrinic acid a,c-diamide adenosyltransferase [Candidatus Omnitrophota bacterium]
MAAGRRRAALKDRAPRTYRERAKPVKKGLLIVYTGEGKGKTSAALGAVFRALGHGWRVGVVQFIKGKWKTGESLFARGLKGRLDFFCMGEGFTWDTKDFKRDVECARRAWGKCMEMMLDARYRLVVFDELSYVLKYHFLPVGEVLAGLKKRPPQTHCIITGRDAPKELVEEADLVTDMRLVKHPYQEGIQAQLGIDF